MRWKIYDADTCELLDEVDGEETLLPKPGESWPLVDGVKTVVKAVHVGDAAMGEIFIAVKVR